MAIGDWTEEDVKNGLREPSGVLVGGLIALDYVKGREDFVAGAVPPAISSASYDLGRRRALEEAEAAADFRTQMLREGREQDERIHELLADRPDLIAEYDREMAEIRGRER